MKDDNPPTQERASPPPLSGILQDHLDRASSDHGQEARIRALLLQRPRFSVRLRLTLLLSCVFAVAAAVSAISWYILSGVERSVALVSITEKFTQEVQEARRYEKNYFLYGSDLANVSRHTDKAERMLQQGASEIGSVVGMEQIRILQDELRIYCQLISRLIVKSDEPGFAGSTEFKEMVGALRDHGSKMVSRAFDINEAERREIASSTTLAKRFTSTLFVILLAICIYSGVHIYRHIIARLSRLTEVTRRFAAGDFTPIMPARKYRDEFSSLAIALNHMMYELERRQRILVESHKIRAVGNLTAGVAHEINNPLNNIMLTSEMLREDWQKLSDKERLEMAVEITQQAERARSIVKNLLDFARETEAKVEHLQVDRLLEEVIRLAQNQVKISKIKLHVDVGRNLPPVCGDRSQLVEVFLNLIINAIDAMPGGGHLIVRATREKGVGFISIHVQDTGTGIPPHLVQSVFDPFFTTKPKGKGTGIGLSVSKGIVNHHGGDIDVMSKVGVGTTFTVHLPCVPVPAELSSINNDVNHAKAPLPEEGRPEG